MLCNVMMMVYDPSCPKYLNLKLIVAVYNLDHRERNQYMVHSESGNLEVMKIVAMYYNRSILSYKTLCNCEITSIYISFFSVNSEHTSFICDTGVEVYY